MKRAAVLWLAEVVPLLSTAVNGCVIMAIAAIAGRGHMIVGSEDNLDKDYQIAFPTLPSGRIVLNTLYLQVHESGRPYIVDYFRYALT